MTREDKELLLKDLCARLPYGMKGIIRFDENNTTFTVEGIYNNVLHLSDAENCYVEDFKPYLRPMSSMTEEEKKELFNLSTMGNTGVNTCWESFGVEIISTHPRYGDYYSTDYKVIDWLNKKMFDYRGLIEKGLVIEVTEENNPYKE